MIAAEKQERSLFPETERTRAWHLRHAGSGGMAGAQAKSPSQAHDARGAASAEVKNMAKETPVKDMSGRSPGMLRTESNGGQLLPDWPSQKVLGKYRKRSDTTIDWKPRKLPGKGDLLLLLSKR